MKTIGIKLADGTFFPVLEENNPAEKSLELTTAHNNQTKIMVDLYRSKACSMDDAEYVDSLQIENLNAHPNGEPTISFCVSIDEDNQLSARIKDPETGNQSNTTITLVSRTLEERLVTDEYNISSSNLNEDFEEDKHNIPAAAAGAIAGAAAGAGLLSLASKLNEEESKEESIADNDDISTEDTTEVDDEMVNVADAIDFGDTSDEETAVDIDDVEEPVALEDPEVSEDLDSLNDLPLSNEEKTTKQLEDDFDIDLGAITATAMENNDKTSEDFELPEESENIVSEDFASDEPVNEPTDESTDEPMMDEIIQDENNSEETISDDMFAEIPSTETTDSETTDFEEDSLPDDMFAEEPVAEDSTINFEDSIPEDTDDQENLETTFDIPDSIDNTQPIDKIASDEQFFEHNTDAFGDPVEKDFSLPDFDDIPEEEDINPELPDDLFNDDTFNDNSLDNFDFDNSVNQEPAPAQAGGLSFTGLYDKETEMGVSGSQDDDIKKKTKVPVIICVICAIICIIATLLILFVIPSKYNLINKSEKEVVAVETPVEPAEEVVELEPEPIPEAKEDEVVVVEKAEEVVPEQPEVVEEKLEDISYKITWGDTLWDIADTYYKNPWRYKYIARYNGIKNPDHIVSGTYITIPAE